MKKANIQDWSDRAQVLLLSKIYETVYSDGTMFADVVLLQKTISDHVCHFVLGDNCFTDFCSEEFLVDVAMTIDYAIDDKAIHKNKLRRISELSLCSFISKNPLIKKHLDYKYTLDTIFKMTMSDSAEFALLYDKFNRDVTDMLNTLGHNIIYSYGMINKGPIGCTCIFLEKNHPTHLCKPRTLKNFLSDEHGIFVPYYHRCMDKLGYERIDMATLLKLTGSEAVTSRGDVIYL